MEKEAPVRLIETAGDMTVLDVRGSKLLYTVNPGGGAAHTLEIADFGTMETWIVDTYDDFYTAGLLLDDFGRTLANRYDRETKTNQLVVFGS